VLGIETLLRQLKRIGESSSRFICLIGPEQIGASECETDSSHRIVYCFRCGDLFIDDPQCVFLSAQF